MKSKMLHYILSNRGIFLRPLPPLGRGLCFLCRKIRKMPKDTLINVIRTHQIRDARQFTAFLTGDKTKGFITHYPEGYGVSLWVPRLQALRDYYGVNTWKERKH